MQEYQSTVNSGQKVIILKQLNDLYGSQVDALQQQCRALHETTQGMERALKETQGALRDARGRCEELERGAVVRQEELKGEQARVVEQLQAKVSDLRWGCGIGWGYGCV